MKISYLRNYLSAGLIALSLSFGLVAATSVTNAHADDVSNDATMETSGAESNDLFGGIFKKKTQAEKDAAFALRCANKYASMIKLSNDIHSGRYDYDPELKELMTQELYRAIGYVDACMDAGWTP